MEENEEYLKLRQRKIKKHITVEVNNVTVKILNYKFITHTDPYSNEEKKYIELITKVSNAVLNSKKIKVLIRKDERIIDLSGSFILGLSQPGLFRYKYEIVEFKEIKNMPTSQPSMVRLS